MNVKSIVGSILIIASSEILTLLSFVLISNKLEQTYFAWIFSTMIIVGILTYLWFIASKMSIKQVLLISIIIALLFVLFYWFISFVWFKGLAKDIYLLSYYHIVTTIKLLMMIILAHLIVLLVFRQVKIVYEKTKNKNSI